MTVRKTFADGRRSMTIRRSARRGIDNILIVEQALLKSRSLSNVFCPLSFQFVFNWFQNYICTKIFQLCPWIPLRDSDSQLFTLLLTSQARLAKFQIETTGYNQDIKGNDDWRQTSGEDLWIDSWLALPLLTPGTFKEERVIWLVIIFFCIIIHFLCWQQIRSVSFCCELPG